MSTLLSSSSRPATYSTGASVSGGASSFFSHIGAFVGEVAYVGMLIGQALRASRENPEAFEGTGVTVAPWIAWPGDLSSL